MVQAVMYPFGPLLRQHWVTICWIAQAALNSWFMCEVTSSPMPAYTQSKTEQHTHTLGPGSICPCLSQLLFCLGKFGCGHDLHGLSDLLNVLDRFEPQWYCTGDTTSLFSEVHYIHSGAIERLNLRHKCMNHYTWTTIHEDKEQGS